MKQARPGLNLAVAAVAAWATWTVPAPAQDRALPADTGALLDELALAGPDRWRRIERQILREWGRSGSAAADYLYQRGQEALQSGDAEGAISHFSAVIDHAPDFTEAWNARATAFYMANRLGPAMADIEEVLAREPRHFGALAGMGAIFEQTERLEAARAAYEAALAIHPHRPQLREALARLALALAGREA